jgi:isopenicillin N synthase-like dioxygenase
MEEEIADFKAVMLDFEARNWRHGMDILSCFALKLGFAEEFFTYAHDPKSSEYQCTLRLLRPTVSGAGDKSQRRRQLSPL